MNLRLMDGPSPVPLADQLAEMGALRDEGKIAGIGLSNAGLPKLCEAPQITDIAYVPFFPLGSAMPGAVRVPENPAHLQENLAASEIRLDDEAMAALG